MGIMENARPISLDGQKREFLGVACKGAGSLVKKGPKQRKDRNGAGAKKCLPDLDNFGDCPLMKRWSAVNNGCESPREQNVLSIEQVLYGRGTRYLLGIKKTLQLGLN